ncbi:PREDICTED: uncharacterized protein LOC108557431 [Nicrophorus vespilloides]|uniref:Uncharacterized protein LOC108557431 n=1 Tax=Nicrophorus vespilloides TaxID=110193 RepID=A0ABM1M4C7_NICVS|nr:PREDICTED: uncharacterized protein LOC108557431 [Nicrophorus vespilloides]
MRHSAAPHRLDYPAASESVDTLTTTTTGSQHTVYAEVVEVEEYELGSDVEPEAHPTLKLTSRRSTLSGPRRKSRDETKKEIQADDEATLRDLLIRYTQITKTKTKQNKTKKNKKKTTTTNQNNQNKK